MDRWFNRVAVVTGASAGIGAALVLDLVRANIKVVGLAQSIKRIEEIRNSLPKELQSRLYPLKCDVANENDIKKSFAWVEQNLGGTDILVNNAGCLRYSTLLQSDNTKDLKAVVDTNLMGLVYCTREAFISMKKRKFAGHVIHVNSIVGHQIPNSGMDYFNIYPATKYAVTALTETCRQEFRNAGTQIKITSVSPGFCDTEIFSKEIEKQVKENNPMLRPKDVSDAIMYTIGTPPSVQIHELTIKPVGEKY